MEHLLLSYVHSDINISATLDFNFVLFDTLFVIILLRCYCNYILDNITKSWQSRLVVKAPTDKPKDR